MSKYVLLGLSLALALAAQAQTKTKPAFTPEGDSTLPDVMITSTRFPENRKNVAQKVDVVNATYIKKMNTQNTGDLLMSTGNVFVQKSQQGGSSPVIRGFEASRVLLVVDGIRMNNAIYRSGHLQNVITVDQNMLEQVEITNGPGSTLHGSDALGGVITLKSRDPRLDSTGKKWLQGSAFARYSSANNEKTAHAHLNFGGRRLALLVSGTFSNFGDMRMGDQYPEDYPNFGRRSQYVQRINGLDSIVTNDDDRIQRFSGYKQWDATAKLLFQQNQRVRHMLNVQHSNTNDVPRYDRLQDIRNGRLRFAEWYYGPQTRNLIAYTLDARLNGFFDELKVTASYQDIEESRYQRDRGNVQRQNRIESVGVTGLYADLRKVFGNHELNTGVDVQLNDVKSRAFRLDITNGNTSALDTRYPEKNQMNTYAWYAQHLVKLAGGKWVINDGIRLQGSRLESEVVDKSTAFRPFDKIAQNTFGVSGNIGAVYMPTPKLRISSTVAKGFRAPNIDDLAKIFESSTASRQLVVPNTDIKPEKTISPDINLSWQANSWIKLEGSAYYTWFIDAIIKAPFPVNGQDSTVYNGIKYQTLASQNAASGRVYGFQAAVTLTPAKGWQLYSTINYTRGTYTKPGNVEVPLDHIPPVFGKTSLTYTHGRFNAELWSLYNGWKRIEDYNPDGEDNAQYATADGMPSWITLNARAQYQLGSMFTLQAALENIFDRNYRHFASGFSAPGRNVVVALRASF